MNFRTTSPLYLAAIACVLLSACGTPAQKPGEDAPPVKEAADPVPLSTTKTARAADKVVVYYFHGTHRCPTCLGIQKALEETIEDNFSKESEAGLLVYEALNFEEDKNRALVDKLSVAFSTMVVATQAGETPVQWENAEKLWDLAQDKDALKAYMNEKIRATLKLIGAV